MVTKEYKRKDRTLEETRPITAKAGIIKNADGSGYFKIGNTEAYAAVYGPRNLYPRFMQNPSTGILRVNYAMMPFSGSGDRVRPGPNRRAKEISMVIEKAFMPVLDLKEFPNAVVDIFIELPQTDAGTRCAGICAASIALADAGLPMKDMVTAISFGVVNGTVVVDLDYSEESYEGEVVDMPMAILPNSGNISLLQADGIFTKENFKKILELAKKTSQKIFEVQKQALKDKYKSSGKEE